MIPSWPERSLDRRPHHFLVVLFGEGAERLCIYTLPLLHHLLESPWRHADQYHAGARPHVLEGVCSASRNEHHGLRGRAHDAVAKFDLKFTTHDVEKLVLRLVDVGGWSALRRDGLTKQT